MTTTERPARQAQMHDRAAIASPVPGDPYQQDTLIDETLTAEELAFQHAHAGVIPAGKLLRSRTNPDGWRLEDLLKQLRAELAVQNVRLAMDDDTLSDAHAHANNLISAALFEAEGYQRRIAATISALLRGSTSHRRPR